MNRYVELSNTQIAEIIDEWIHNERNRGILKRRFCDGWIYSKIAEEYEMSDKQIMRIIYREQEHLFRHINIRKE